MNHDVHNFSRRLEGQLRCLNTDSTISNRNKKLVLGFKDYAFSDGISIGRIVRYLFDLRVIAHLLEKDFENANKEDIQVLLGKLESSGRYAQSTIRDLKITLRKFYKWLRNSDDFPEEVKWFKIHLKSKAIKNPEDMLNEEEVFRLINGCRNARDKALISVLYESGCRVGEILPIRLKDILFDNYGALALVNGKTGFRRIRLIASTPYLTEWLNNHPFKENKGAFLWIDKSLKRLSYAAGVRTIEKAAKRVKIYKKVNPHNFRHSRATFLANHLTEAQMDEYLGWVQGSKMPSIYVHLSGRNVDSPLLKVYGIENKEEKRTSIFKPRECARCDQVNQATNKFCSRCGMPLDEESTAEFIKQGMDRKEADGVLNKLIEDQEFREMLLKKIGVLKSNLA